MDKTRRILQQKFPNKLETIHEENHAYLDDLRIEHLDFTDVVDNSSEKKRKCVSHINNNHESYDDGDKENIGDF